MILADEGKLSPDDDVAKYLPEFTGQLMRPPVGISGLDLGPDKVLFQKPDRPIKLRDLLTHTSGVAPYPPGVSDVYAKRNRTLAETALATALQPLRFEPGTRWEYSNSGIDTLGRVIEVVSGESYEHFLQKRVFDPLGMKDTVFYPNDDQKKRLATIYGKTDGKLTAVPNALIGLPPHPKHPDPGRRVGVVGSGPGEALSHDAPQGRTGRDAHPEREGGRGDDPSPDRRHQDRLCGGHEFRLWLGRCSRTEGRDRHALGRHVRSRRRVWHSGLDRPDQRRVRDPPDPAQRASQRGCVSDAQGAARVGGGGGEAVRPVPFLRNPSTGRIALTGVAIAPGRGGRAMKCQRCTKQATLHITEVLGEDRFDEVHLCEDCAKKYLYEPQQKKPTKGGPASENDSDDDIPPARSCPACGLTFLEFRNHGRFGCPNDYDAFKTDLLPLMESVHGEVRHAGKRPAVLPGRRRHRWNSCSSASNSRRS